MMESKSQISKLVFNWADSGPALTGATPLRPTAAPHFSPLKYISTSSNELVVAVYDISYQVEIGLKELLRTGWDAKNISIVGGYKNSEEETAVSGTRRNEGLVFWEFGAFWGGVMDVLFESAKMFVPVSGHIFVLGPQAATLFSEAQDERALRGLDALARVLSTIGIPYASALRYEAALLAGKYLVVLHGNSEEMRRVEGLLRNSGPIAFDHYLASDALEAVAQSSYATLP